MTKISYAGYQDLLNDHKVLKCFHELTLQKHLKIDYFMCVNFWKVILFQRGCPYKVMTQ